MLAAPRCPTMSAAELSRPCRSAEPRNGGTRPAATPDNTNIFQRRRRQRPGCSSDCKSSSYGRVVLGTGESAEWCCADVSRGGTYVLCLSLTLI
ncbi:hypothetical protein IG631_00018 [Alternaria alternata]|nr:hypothetical protein IG631_00018 [Alternaria alternata]